MSIEKNILSIREKLPATVTLVSVSKTFPESYIAEAYETGERDFGENRVQELCRKADALPKDIRWHFIGSLQTNKVKYIAPFVHLIHSVESQRLLAAINKEAARCNRVIDVLLEIFVATEESKHGWDDKELLEYMALGEFRTFKNIKIRGVMGMATFTDNKEQIEREFAKLRTVFEILKKEYFSSSDQSFDTVSMGMSSDYQIAVEQGSTMVRVGSSIFGNR